MSGTTIEQTLSELVKKKVNDNKLELLKTDKDEDVWKLSNKFSEINNKYINIKATAKFDELITFKTLYKNAAIQILGNFTTDIENTDVLATYIANYIIKKRAALVYMCILYLEQLDKIAESNTKCSASEKEFQNLYSKINEIQNLTESKNAVTAVTAVTAVKALDVVNDKLNSLLSDVKKLQAQATVNNAALKKKNDLLLEIIPFIAKNTEMGDVPPPS